MKNFVVRLLAAALVLLGTTAAFAAEQTGSIKGKVTGPDGVPIEGAEIIVTGTNLMGQRSQKAKADGTFRFVALPPGPYDVIARAEGFLGQVKKTEVFIGRGSTIGFELTVPEAEGQEIIVREQRPTVDSEQTSVGEVIDQEFLENLPTSRSYQGVAGVVPGVVGGANPNVKGGADDDNAWLIDGVNTSDPVTNTFSSNFNYEAIQQIEVMTNGFSGENQQMGGVINVVTKSGGNEFEGGVSGYYEDDSWWEWVPGNAKKGLECAQYEDGYTPTGDDAEDEANCVDLVFPSEKNFQSIFYDTNAWLGGPIVKDKLWFFTSLQVDASRLRSTAPQPRAYTGYYGLAKLTWQATPSHKLTGQFQTDPTSINNIVQSRYTPQIAEGRQLQGGYFAQLKHEWFARSDLLVETQFFQKTVNIDVGPMPDDNGNVDLTTPPVIGTASAQSAENFYIYSLNRRSRNTLRSKATLYKDDMMGSHEFEAGLDFTLLVEDYAAGVPGNIRFYTRCVPEYRCDGSASGEAVNYYRVEYTGPIRQKTTADTYGFWLQDKWKPTSNLVLQPILRFDLGNFRNDQGDRVISYFALSPRFHFSWDPFSDGRSRLYGGYGRSIDPGKLSLSDFMNQHGIGSKLYLATGPGDYFEGASPFYFSNSGESEQVRAPNLTYPRTDEVFFGFERDIIRGIAVGATYTGKWMRHLYEDDESNLIWNNYGNNIIGNRNNIEDYRFRIRTPGSAVRYYQGLDITVRKRFSDNFNILGSYTLSRTTGTSTGSYTAALDNPEQIRYDFGLMPWDRTHQVKLQGSYEFPFGFTTGLSLNARSGLPYDRYVWNEWDFGYTNRTNERGSWDRTPTAYSADVRFAYERRLPGRYGRLGASLDVFNVTINRQTLGYQGGYLSTYGEDCASPDTKLPDGTLPGGPDGQPDSCSDLLRPSSRLSPLSGRLGIYYKF